MNFDNISKFISGEALILIPTIYVIGAVLKGTNLFKDKYIPVALLPLSVALSAFCVGVNVNAIIQGVLVTGMAVYGNQLIKQSRKDK